ncbi:COP9 signalosome complex subunit 5a [Porphyridium purpureum]|uniref:COP9 signalosome complex subunit 5a n=1 Tax=Porphyridium purpureum TaxID=35688 RepID=A0A5J4YY32_PORPP|nr:COP9 signalosome complex subunit 5a [Porphyridium purpureum]|eukprot:POR9321..scf208_2
MEPARSAQGGPADAVDARRAWELANEVREVDPGAAAQPAASQVADARYRWDEGEQRQALEAKPWTRDPHYFQKVHISAIALIKMVMHARSGGSIEVMGSMQGKIEGNAFVIMDAFPLPVEGTETRVNAQADGYEFMVAYQEKSSQVVRNENVVGWYHSHPGYGCWLSGIDVQTQKSNQTFQDPFLAVVIDPIRTMSAGKVDIGAFRTYPVGYTPQDDGGSREYQSVPMDKIEDFGFHAKDYYALEISYFKSRLDAALLDALWNKYWASTLSSAVTIQNRDFEAREISDIARKIGSAHSQLVSGSQNRLGGYIVPDRSKNKENKLDRIRVDVCQLAREETNSLLGLTMKELLFRNSDDP